MLTLPRISRVREDGGAPTRFVAGSGPAIEFATYDPLVEEIVEEKIAPLLPKAE